jgi:hypothetical protein
MTSFGHNTLASPPCVYSVVLDGFLLVWLTVSNARFQTDKSNNYYRTGSTSFWSESCHICHLQHPIFHV